MFKRSQVTRRTVVAVRDRRNSVRYALLAFAMAASSLAVDKAAPPDVSHVATVTTGAGRQPSIAVLGDGMSLADVVSQSYGRNTPRPAQSAGLDTSKRIGLTKQAPLPPPSGLFGGLFNIAPAPVNRATRTAIPRPLGPPKTYRTVCVKLCDGSYFPVSFSTTRNHFRGDEETCRASCDAPTRLFVFEIDGGSPETMEDVSGVPYMSLATAFKFKSTYDPACRCRAHPWEQEALNRHQRYAEEETAGSSVAEPARARAPQAPARASTPTEEAAISRSPTSGATTAGTPDAAATTTNIPSARTTLAAPTTTGSISRGPADPEPTFRQHMGPAGSPAPLVGERPSETSSTTVLSTGITAAPKAKALKPVTWTAKRMALGSSKGGPAEFGTPPPKRRSASTNEIFRSAFGQ